VRMNALCAIMKNIGIWVFLSLVNWSCTGYMAAKGVVGHIDGDGLLPNLSSHGMTLILLVIFLVLYSLFFVSSLPSFIAMPSHVRLAKYRSLILVISMLWANSLWVFTLLYRFQSYPLAPPTFIPH
jgi:hypothetical protein